MALSKHEIYQEARSLLIRARLYRYIAVAFAFTGLAVFLFMYFTSIEGHLLEAVTHPSIIGAILFPFLPAAVLSFMASRTEAKFYAFLEKHKQKKEGE